MILHLSVSAEAPERVARVMAELWRGEAFPFHPVAGAWIALAGHGEGTALEVYPAGTEVMPGGTALEFAARVGAPQLGATHFAAATPLSTPAVEQIGRREGWLVRPCDRGPFQLIELWAENRILIELLTPEMLPAYRTSMTLDNWRQWS